MGARMLGDENADDIAVYLLFRSEFTHMVTEGVAVARPNPRRTPGWVSDRGTLWTLFLLGSVNVLLHTVFNNQYGFHRDELLSMDNARQLAWGYVVYPPVTALLARVELILFGTSLRGFRFLPAVVQGLIMLLTGLSARKLGGKREAQVLAAVAIGISGYCLFSGSFLSYSSFDYFWWVLAAYFVIRLLNSEDPRWWLCVCAAVGTGLMTKYTMCFFVLGIAGGVLLTPARRYLKSPWLWLGTAIAVLLVLPNVFWQAQHHFISFDFLKSIHARDIRWGWTDHFLAGQLTDNINVVTAPLVFFGLWYIFADSNGRRYRLLGWMYLIPFVAFLLAKGRNYYLAPAYPMLLAAGSVWAERWLTSLPKSAAHSFRMTIWITCTIAGLSAAAVTIPMAPVNSRWWHFANSVNGNFHYEIGWPEMVESIAKVRDTLPIEDQFHFGILAADDGQAGAINLYGPAYHLPRPISGMNSNWMRGYGSSSPDPLIVVGMDSIFVSRNFESCVLAGHITNRYGIDNKAIDGYADIFVCRRLRQPWPAFWQTFQYFG
jgi:hypothetical protein